MKKPWVIAIFVLYALWLLFDLYPFASTAPAPRQEQENISVLPPNPDLDIFILAGQSNMVGWGSLADWPADRPRQTQGIYFFDGSQWRLAQEPMHGKGVGPGLVFAQQIKQERPAKAIGLIPCAWGGSTLKQWSPSESPHTLYGACLLKAREGQRRGTIKGLLWYQGENDCDNITQALLWPGTFARLMDDFRQDLQDPKMPVVFVQIGALASRHKGPGTYEAWDELQTIQGQLELPLTARVTAMDLPLLSDGIHLNTKAQLELGQRLAMAWLSLNDK